MAIKLGQIATVVISSPTMAKKVFQKQDLTFSNRAIPDNVQSQNRDQFSVGSLPVSPQWQKLRKICNSHILASQKLDASPQLRQQIVQGLIADVRVESSPHILSQALFVLVILIFLYK